MSVGTSVGAGLGAEVGKGLGCGVGTGLGAGVTRLRQSYTTLISP